jgi:hypothetical protein
MRFPTLYLSHITRGISALWDGRVECVNDHYLYQSISISNRTYPIRDNPQTNAITFITNDRVFIMRFPFAHFHTCDRYMMNSDSECGIRYPDGLSQLRYGEGRYW